MPPLTAKDARAALHGLQIKDTHCLNGKSAPQTRIQLGEAHWSDGLKVAAAFDKDGECTRMCSHCENIGHVSCHHCNDEVEDESPEYEEDWDKMPSLESTPKEEPTKEEEKEENNKKFRFCQKVSGSRGRLKKPTSLL